MQLVLRLHGGEEDNFADGIVVGQHHDAAVDAHTHTARGRHAVLHSVQEVLVQHLGLVVAALTLLNLLHKAAALIDGIVQLGVSIGQLGVADEQLEALGQAGIFGRALGQRRNLNGIHGDEGVNPFFLYSS